MARRRDTYYKKDPVLGEIELDESTYDAGFVLDPAKLFDELPQPFRLIDKTLDYIFDKTWEAIRERELRASELGLGGKLPVFDNTQQLSEFYHATLLCSSLDGKFMFVVAKNGVIHAVDVETSCVVAVNDELQGLTVLSLCTGRLEDNKHFICLLMENGTAAIFALSGSNLHLLRVFNEDFGVKASLTSYINVSFDGSYLAVGWRIPLKSSWLEIYKVPKEFWINEINVVEEKLLKKLNQEEMAKGQEETTRNHSLDNGSSDSENESTESRPTSLNHSGAQTGYLGETSFTKPTLILKIRAPTYPVPNPASNVSSAMKNIDQDYDVIGTGTNHILLQSYFEHSDKVFRETHQQYLEYLAEKEEDYSTRLPKVHFLTPGRFVPSGIQTAPDQVNSVVVRWSEVSHALIYSLVKSPKDVERKPDIVLTTSSKIVASDVSFCKSYISFGLDNSNIVTWDKLTGLPLTVVSLPSSSTIIDLHFVPTIKEGDPTSSYPKLLVCCANGDLYMVQYGDDGRTNITNLPTSSYKMRDPVVQVTCLPNLPQLVLIQRNSGKIISMDVSTKTLKCQIGLVKPLTMVNGFSYTQATSTLYMKGGCKDEYNEEILPESVCVYKIKVDTLPVVKKYLEESTTVETSRTLTSFDKRIAAIEQHRISSYDKRQRNYRTRWRQLEAELDRIKRPTSLRDSIWFSGTLGV